MTDTRDDIRKAAAALGRLGGAATKGISTPKKSRAAKANGKKGGRPVGSKDRKPRRKKGTGR